MRLSLRMEAALTRLVFVHGVATRSTPDNLVEAKIRDQLFSTTVLGGQGQVVNATWGDLVKTWAWDQASLPMEQERRADAAFGLGRRPETAGANARPFNRVAASARQ